MLKPKYEPTRTFSIEKDGFYGYYYEPAENKFPGKSMVICTGSDGSFLLAKLGSAYFVDVGMPVLALGYFNVLGAPNDPLLCPVEYMQRAVSWLRTNKQVHVGVWGISLGGEYSLLCGSLFPEIECVVACAPVHIVAQCGSFIGGLHCCEGSPFSRNGMPVPCVMAGETKEELGIIVRQMKKSFLRHHEPDMLFFYHELLNKPHAEEADIRVENIHGPVLLISGKEDVMVPSDWTCEEVVKRLKAHDHPYPYRHNSYSPLSHYACPLRPMTSSIFRVERHRAKECNASRAKAWADTLAFLRDEWVINE